MSPDGFRVELESWRQEESNRVSSALAEAAFWQYAEPHRADFWECFDRKLLAHYPEERFEWKKQAGLSDFGTTEGSA
jgi:hypothetical protein